MLKLFVIGTSILVEDSKLRRAIACLGFGTGNIEGELIICFGKIIIILYSFYLL